MKAKLKIKGNLRENLQRFRVKNLNEQLSDDDMLDIIMTYTKDSDKASKELKNFKSTGKFTDSKLSSKILQDPRFKSDNLNSSTTNRWEQVADTRDLLKLITITDFDAPPSWSQDYSDWSDISAVSAEWDDTGEELNDEEIEFLNEKYYDFVAEKYNGY
jgi:hypothetical protein